MDKPNIIIIFCDDLGYGDLSCYGSDENCTPRLDKMAEEGIKFTDFYVASSVCSPSRAALMTGCYPKRVGLATGTDYVVLMPGDAIGLNSAELTIPKMLKSSGYKTKMVGKWHLGDQEEFFPTNHGFDSYLGLPYSNDMLPDHPNNDKFDFPPLPLIKNKNIIEEDPNQVSLTDRYTREAVSFIKENKDNPFFLYFAHMYVHVPIYAPYKYLERSKNGPYGAAVEHIDYSMGVILDTLKEQGIDDNTIVIFTSDNGSDCQNGGSNGPLRGTKGTTWEGGMREPCIIRWQGKIAANRVCNEIATSMDFLPTIARIIDFELPLEHTIDGKDMTPLLFEEDKESKYTAFYYYEENNLNAVRYGKWKLHLEEKLLYNLETDIGETKDLYKMYPDIVERLNEYAEICRQDIGDERYSIEGKNCREVGRVKNAKTLLPRNGDDIYFMKEYD